jgi:hypothetical protein
VVVLYMHSVPWTNSPLYCTSIPCLPLNHTIRTFLLDDFFHLACFCSSSMLLYVHQKLMTLRNTLLFCSLMDIWVVSKFVLLPKTAAIDILHEFISEHVFNFYDEYTGVKLLSSIINVCLALSEIAKLFSKVVNTVFHYH